MDSTYYLHARNRQTASSRRNRGVQTSEGETLGQNDLTSWKFEAGTEATASKYGTVAGISPQHIPANGSYVEHGTRVMAPFDDEQETAVAGYEAGFDGRTSYGDAAHLATPANIRNNVIEGRGRVESTLNQSSIEDFTQLLATDPSYRADFSDFLAELLGVSMSIIPDIELVFSYLDSIMKTEIGELIANFIKYKDLDIEEEYYYQREKKAILAASELNEGNKGLILGYFAEIAKEVVYSKLKDKSDEAFHAKFIDFIDRVIGSSEMDITKYRVARKFLYTLEQSEEFSDSSKSDFLFCLEQYSRVGAKDGYEHRSELVKRARELVSQELIESFVTADKVFEFKVYGYRTEQVSKWEKMLREDGSRVIIRELDNGTIGLSVKTLNGSSSILFANNLASSYGMRITRDDRGFWLCYGTDCSRKKFLGIDDLSMIDSLNNVRMGGVDLGRKIPKFIQYAA